MLNNSPVVLALASQLDSEHLLKPAVTARRRVASDPMLPSRLPSTGFLQREAEHDAPMAIIRQLRRSPPPSPPAEQDDNNHGLTRSSSVSSATSSYSAKSTPKSVISPKIDNSASWKDPQPFEIFRAVEKKDMMFLMEVRDRAFPLLLRKTGDATPLLHAMRIGISHRDVAIVLLGAFSRWINHLEDADFALPRTKVILKALRTNLKLAIDLGLSKSQSDLTASFLQTLIMSEGDKWVLGQAHNVSLALRDGTAGKPVQTAGTSVRRFATKELGKAESIATLEDYVANATADLLMLGAWTSALDTVQADPIPSYYFARDDRVYRAFVERLDQHKVTIQNTLGRRLRWQLRVLRKALEGRMTTYRRKVEVLEAELDEGDGV